MKLRRRQHQATRNQKPGSSRGTGRAKPRSLRSSAPALSTPSRRATGDRLNSDPRWTLASDPAAADESSLALGVGSLMVTPQMRERERQEREAAQSPDGSAAAVEDGASSVDLADQIRSLEARLDKMIRGAGMGGDPEDEVPPSIREQVGTAAREVVERLAAPLPSLERPGADDGTVVEAARELFSSDYYLRQWGRVGMRNRSEDVDEFGYDPTYEQRFLPIAQFLYQRYFRVEVEGVDRIPEEGRCLIVANHSGTIPLDGIMLRMALRQEHPAHRPLRWLAEDYLYYLPFAGSFITRIGAVRACQENAERLLTQENVVAAFPEGVKGIGKLFKERYRLQRFGRGGFIRLCLRTSTPIVPCAIVGAEETGPMLARAEYVARVLGLPYIPITPTFPLFGPLGLVPAPTKWRITFGEPVSLAEYGRKAADDHVLVGRLTERVRANIQRMLDETVDSRSSVWLG